MTAETLTILAASVLSFAFGYVPKLKDWYDALEATHKRLVMAGLLLAIAAAIFGLSCWQIVPPEYQLTTCDSAGFVALVRAYVLALAANQGTYMLLVRKV